MWALFTFRGQSSLACAAVIRAATEADILELIAAYEWLFAPPGAQPPSWDPQRAAHALARAMASERAAVLVVDADGVIAGFCTVYLDLESVRFGQRAFVEDLAVDPSRRSQGHGKALLDAAKEWADSNGAAHLELDSADARTDAHRFYEREQPTWRSRSFGWQL